MSGPEPRPAGELRIGEPLRRRLARLRALHVRCTPAELDVALVNRVEAALEQRLPDEVLALFASGTDDLEASAGIVLASMIDRDRMAGQRGCPQELLALGLHADSVTFTCIKRAVGPDEPTELIDFDAKDQSLRSRLIVQWVEDRVEQRRDLLSCGDAADLRLIARKPTPAEIELLRPSLVVPEVAAAPASAPRVEHPTFGQGEVIADIGAGDARKLTVRFAGGTKVLLARVLSFLP